MNVKSAFLVFLALSLPVTSFAQYTSDDYWGHSVLVESSAKVYGEKLKSAIAKAEQDSRGDLDAYRAQLVEAHTKLSDMHSKLLLAVAMQDTSVLAMVSVSFLALSGGVARVSLEANERYLIGGSEKIVPNIWGLGWLNNTLNWARRVLDKAGRAMGKVVMITAVTGGASSVFLFYITRNQVTDFAEKTAQSLANLETLIAKVDLAQKKAGK